MRPALPNTLADPARNLCFAALPCRSRTRAALSASGSVTGQSDLSHYSGPLSARPGALAGAEKRTASGLGTGAAPGSPPSQPLGDQEPPQHSIGAFPRSSLRAPVTPGRGINHHRMVTSIGERVSSSGPSAVSRTVLDKKKSPRPVPISHEWMASAIPVRTMRSLS